MSVLSLRGIRKSFAGVEVLHGVDLDLAPGSVHALVGENGAGNSTLIKVLSGVHRRDAGEIVVDGVAVESLSPHVAQSLGIVTIYQERNLIPWLSVGENILLGDLPVGGFPVVKWKRLYARAEEILASLNLDLDARRIVATMGAAEQQAVEIAKALYKKARIVVMDEPTASLSGSEIDNLFRIICQVKQSGAGVIYISHRLDEVFQVADQVTVLRDGRRILTKPIPEITKPELVKAMVGEELAITQLGSGGAGETLLEVRGLTVAGSFGDASVTLRRGAIIGIAGALGSGRSQLLRCIAGIDRADSGTVRFRGEDATGMPLSERIRRGICYVPGERDLHGLILGMSVAGNTTLANLPAVTHGPMMDLRRERELAREYMKALAIQAWGVQQEVQYLSGGNRQKVMLSKWLCRGVEVFLLDEPTQGVDVGAREEIHRIMKRLLEEGKGILMVSSDLDELMNMSTTIAVMNKGRIVAALDARTTNRQEVLSYAIGTTQPGNACVEV
ncbi:MAG TPA: sugar ABC transporter ATP-binding protein [Spirochaetia bacterium]